MGVLPPLDAVVERQPEPLIDTVGVPMNKLSIDDLDLEGAKKVLMRVDFNVPIRDGKVDGRQAHRRGAADDPCTHSRRGAAVILMSHLGRPKGQVKPEFSLRPVARLLAEHLGREVGFVEDCVGPVVEQARRRAGAR